MNVLRETDIEKIINAYKNKEEIEKYSKLVSLEEIKENDYNLNIPRYIDTSAEEKEIDLLKVSEEIKEINKEIEDLQKLIEKDCEEL